LKGKSWRSVKARDVSYQLLRAAQIPTIGLVALAAVGDIQDDAKRDLAFLADRIGLDWLLLDRGDLARLLSAYRELCPKDGTWTHGAACPACGYGRRPTRRQPPTFQILTLEDVSFAPAKRYAAHILVPPGLDEREVESRVGAAVAKIRSERYSRNELVEAAHGNRDADVVFLFVYENVADRPFANWICRALWISPDLDQRWHPSTFGEPASDPSLRIDWNESYDVVSTLLEDRQDKGSYLKALDAFVRAAEPIVAQARPLLEEAELTPELETKLAALVAPIEDLPRPDRMKAAPHELADLDNLYEGVDADLLNLALPFGPRGQTTWPEPARRRWLARQAIEMFDLDLVRLSRSREQAL
jgi:hypothetical protein